MTIATGTEFRHLSKISSLDWRAVGFEVTADNALQFLPSPAFGGAFNPGAATVLCLGSAGSMSLVTTATFNLVGCTDHAADLTQHSVGFACGDKFGHRLGNGFSVQHRKEG